MLESFTVTTFEPRLGDTFCLQVDDGQSVDVVLTDATALPAAASGPTREPFSIVFRGPSGTVLPQRIYRLDHVDMGSFELFLVPVASDGDGVRYEAVFA